MFARNRFSVLLLALNVAGAAHAATISYDGTSRGVHISIQVNGTTVQGDAGDSTGLMYKITGQVSGQTVTLHGQPPSSRKIPGFDAKGTVLGTLGLDTSRISVANVPLPLGVTSSSKAVPVPTDFLLNCSNGKKAPKGQAAPTLSFSGSATVTGSRSSTFTGQATLTPSGTSYTVDGNITAQTQGDPNRTTIHVGGVLDSTGRTRQVSLSVRSNAAQKIGAAPASGTGSFDASTNTLTFKLTNLAQYGFADATITLR